MTPDDIRNLFDLQRRASRAQPDVPLMVRRERLLRMRKLLDEHGPALAAAVQADFGMRSPRLTEVADLFVLRSQLAHTLRHLARWCRRTRVRTPLFLQPARGWIERQPLGVVGVISPWNYPVQLALAPAIGALAAGNRVMLKPSELTPHTSAQLAALVSQFFAPDEFCVVQGDAATAALVASLPFDHGVHGLDRRGPQGGAGGGGQPHAHHAGAGRQVARHHRRGLRHGGRRAQDRPRQAAQRGPDLHRAGLRDAAARQRSRLCRSLPRRGGAAVPVLRGQPGLRLHHQPAPSRAAAHHAAAGPDPGRRGACHGARAGLAPPPPQGIGDGVGRQMAPVLVFGATPGMQLMQEEIFGPVLPVLSYERLDDAIAHINARPRPLALYWFGRSEAVQGDVLRRTVSGGVSVNDTLMHIAHDNLPFGGVGDSGWGRTTPRPASCAFATRSLCWRSRAGPWDICCIRPTARASTGSWRCCGA